MKTKWESSPERYMHQKRSRRENIITLCVKVIVSLKTQPEIDLDRTIGLTNRNEQKLFWFLHLNKQL